MDPGMAAKRYETLAEDIAASIANGTLKPGDRLPSVRQTRSSRNVSAATVFEAYYLLESRGLIQSRPRSGYYVAAPPSKSRAAVPTAPSKPDGQAREVKITDLIFDMLQAATRREVVPLGSAFPSPLFFPLPRLGRALAASATHLDPWSTVEHLTPGSLELRRQVAQRYLLDGVRADVDEIVVTNGAMEALNLCLAATCKPGSAVVVESPCFYACLQALERQGLQAIEVATDPRTGMDLDALETILVRDRPSAVWVMTNFQNPLGCSMTAEKKQALVELVHRQQVPLIEDDVYHELYFDPQRPASTKAFDRDGWVLHCSSFSKTLAPGYRIGWANAGRFAREVAQQKLGASLATSIPVQLALASYLERGSYDRHLRGLRARLRTQRDVYAALIGEVFPTGTRVSHPDGGYFLWVELPDACDALALAQRAMAEGTSVSPGPIFSPAGAFRDCLRVNFGHPLTMEVADAVRRVGTLARD